MKKYMVSIEFQYTTPEEEDESEYACHDFNKIVTIGVYDTMEEAIKNGNGIFPKLEFMFPLNPHYNKRERFSIYHTLISNIGYIRTPFSFFAKITPLDISDMEDTISDIMKNMKGSNV